MFDLSLDTSDLDLNQVRADLLRAGGVAAVEAALRSPLGPMLRTKFAKVIVDQLVPARYLVPECYRDFRTPVRDAMCFVISRLSAERLAPKVVEQLQLPTDTRPEKRLLCLIAKVPGLQKLGQVIARNHGLRPSLRRALIQLENGIHDTTAVDVSGIIRNQLAEEIAAHDVRIDHRILSEASVSTVMRFTWRNRLGHREAGVFKVLKPDVPLFFAEDMQILQELADVFGKRHKEYGRVAQVLPDTFAKVRRLLQHEVDFPGEQAALLRAANAYRSIRGVRIPILIPELCTPTITAMTMAPGKKVVDALARAPRHTRARIAERLIEAFVIAPLLAQSATSVFHADPHAGNLLYDTETGDLTIVDWALKEELTREQRRRLALLIVFVTLRDPFAAAEQVLHLAESRIVTGSRRRRSIRDIVVRFINELSLTEMPGPVQAMRLLEECAVTGVRFPAALIMFSKMMFTLNDVLDDIGEERSSIAYVGARYAFSQLSSQRTLVRPPLKFADWLAVPCSSAILAGRLLVRLQKSLLDATNFGRTAEPSPTA